MKEISVLSEDLGRMELEGHLKTWLDSYSGGLKKVLLLPPDGTRYHSKAGLITQLLYQMLTPKAQVDILPALGTHQPMTDAELRFMFGDGIPLERFFNHDWRNDVVKIGEVPADFVAHVSAGLVSYAIPIEINRRLLDPSYDLVVSIGQIVPHEVVGMANYSKNILVGCGGRELINKSHFLGAAYGMERMMGQTDTPVRRVFDYAETGFLKRIPLQYILTVTSTIKKATRIHGLFIGKSRALFEAGARESQKRNLDLLDSPLEKVVVYLDPQEFKSTWLGNKAIYRTRMAIADGGELLILAPGVRQFGEDAGIDSLIRKYGYVGAPKVLELVKQNPDLAGNLSAAAHLIHGSSEGRFIITYAPGHLTQREVEAANFSYRPLADALRTYDPARLQDGFNTLNSGEKIFYISNPALGLWALKEKF
ncbi:MAG: lactate racemase domain-containing protein [Firmicutes bacterium]|nr:lactate racemase domain-containing protein [Bacillota bacterium]